MYILIGYLILAFLGWMSYFCIHHREKWIVPLTIVVLVLLFFSFPLGRDMSSYVMAFNRVSSFADAFKYHLQRNIGFNALLYLAKLICPNYIFFRVIYNAIVISLIGYTVFKNSKNVLLSILILIGSGIITVYYASGIRQMMAMAIFFFAYFQLLMKRKTIAYYFLSVVALSFHEVAIVMLAVPLVLSCKRLFSKNPRKVFILCMVFVLLAFFTVRYVMPLLYQYAGSDSTWNHILIYFSETSFSIMGVLLRVILFGFNAYLYYSIKPEKRNEMYTDFFLVTLFSLSLYLAFCDYSLVARVSDFLAILEVIMIPNMLSDITEQKKMVFGIIGVIVINLILLYSDMNEKTDIPLGTMSYTLQEYPYIPLWDTNQIYTIIGY